MCEFFNREKELCDVKLIFENGEEICAHKDVLAANSEYFNIMFNGGFKESGQSGIIINMLDPIIVKPLINFMYTFELVITVENSLVSNCITIE